MDAKSTHEPRRGCPVHHAAPGARPQGTVAYFDEDERGRIVVWSTEAEALYGYPAAEMVGQPAAALELEGADAARQRLIANLRATRTPIETHTVHRHANGAEWLVRQELSIAQSGDTATVRTRILDARAAHPEPHDVWRSGAWIRALVETAVDAIVSIDEDARIIYMNPAAEALFGYTAAETVGNNVNMLMPEPYAGEHDGYIRHYLETGERRIIGVGREIAGRHKSGRTFPIHLAVSEFRYGDRRIFTGIIHDITEQRRAQEEKDRLLRQIDQRNKELTCLYQVGETIWSQEKFDVAVFQRIPGLLRKALASPDAACVRIQFDNEVFESAGCRETPHRLMADIVVNDRKRGLVEVFYPDGTGHRAESRAERGLVEAIAKMLGEAAARAEAEAQIIQASKLASIGELAAGVGHEINNPINGIINCADILMKMTAEGSKQRQFAELMRAEANRIAVIVKNLLTFSRQEREQHSPARLCDIVSTVLSLCRKKLAHSQIDLRVDVPDDLPKFKCRNEQIQQVLMNLIINAMHALDDRYPDAHPDKVLSITAHTLDNPERPTLRLTIEDHGCGISPVHVERIFDPFFTTKGRDKGTGLGLSVSDGIVRDHGGTIHVVSERGRYTRFHVDLPYDNGWALGPPSHSPDEAGTPPTQET